MSDKLREFAASSNGDRWFLGRHDENGLAYVVHKASAPSGGAVTQIEIGAFLTSRPPSPSARSFAPIDRYAGAVS
jgi:hypothetical protein